MKTHIFTKIDSEKGYKPYFTYDHDHSNWKFGDWILIQHVENDTEEVKISTPIYALFAGFSIWDQALVINYVEEIHCMKIDNADPEVKQIALWHDNAIVLGHWKHKPTVTELKAALKEQIRT
jgi:hypothetical protein